MSRPALQPQHQPVRSQAETVGTKRSAEVSGPDDVPPSARRQSAGHCRASAPTTTTTKVSVSGRAPVRAGRIWKVLLAGMAGAAALLFSSYLTGDDAADNRAHHAQASAHMQTEGNGIKWMMPAGPVSFVNRIPLGADDFDETTTRAFFNCRTEAEADQVLMDAQKNLIDSASFDGLPVTPVRPSLSDGMRDEIVRGDTRFFHIFLHDSCAEDGDVVDLLINGRRFVTVPITHAGTTLSVPLNAGVVVSVRGVLDGGGGITVACRTSLGQGFVRDLAEGEEQILAGPVP